METSVGSEVRKPVWERLSHVDKKYESAITGHCLMEPQRHKTDICVHTLSDSTTQDAYPHREVKHEDSPRLRMLILARGESEDSPRGAQELTGALE